MAKIPAIFILTALTVAGSAASSPEKAAGAARPAAGLVSFDYSIAFWSIPFGRTHFDAQIGPASYRTQSHFETSGIINAFWQSTIDASSTGQISTQRVAPMLYDSFYRRGAKHQRVKLSYSADRMPVTYADPPYNTQKYPVTDIQKKAGVDPLAAATAFLTGLHASSANPCGTVASVFDGRRRYNIEFTWIRDESVRLENGLYSGSAHLCQLHYDQIAGFKPKILKEGRALPPAYAWIAEIPSVSAPNGHYLLPLKLWASTGFGTVTATLTQMQIANRAG